MLTTNPYREHDDHHTYQVSVGHTTFRVEGRSTQEAIERAKQRLCSEMPRLWDIIQSLEPQKFDVRTI